MIKTLLLYFTFGISICFISWIVGIIGHAALMKSASYGRLKHLNFIRSDAVNQMLGIRLLRWIVKNTFFRIFNPNLKVDGKNINLAWIREEMCKAEISHLIAFTFTLGFALYKGITVDYLFGVVIMIPNVFMNLYPSLLQQENKRRIDRLIGKRAATQAHHLS